MDLGVKDKVFAIVGGSAGMGLAAAEFLVADGARIGLISRSQQKVESRARALADKSGTDVRGFVGDGAREGSVEQAIDDMVRAFGKLNGLLVTVGAIQTRKNLEQLTDADWETYFQDHLMTTVRSCRAAIPHLVAAGGGTIVTISAYSIRAQKSLLIGYTAMKAAIATITKNIAISYGAQGIRANVVAPGFVATESAEGVMQQAAAKYRLPPMEAINKALVEDYKMNVALGRVGRTEELGELIAFLLSSRAGYLTGAIINCDGGTQF